MKKTRALFTSIVLGSLLVAVTSCADKKNTANNTPVDNKDEEKITLNITNADIIAEYTGNDKYINKDSFNQELFSKIDRLESSDNVSVIIKIDDYSITNEYKKLSNTKVSLSDFSNSPAMKAKAAEMISKQNEIAKQLLKEGLIEEVTHNYTTLVNGFSAKTKYGKVSKLESKNTLKSVTIGDVYAKVKETSDQGASGVVTNVVDVYETGIFNSSTVEYDGSNTAVAILDSGFDIHHTVFHNMPEIPLYEMSDIDDKLKDTVAYSYNNSLRVEDVYVNAKIPFAYDYADKDSDVAPAKSNHGTHVAGIIGGKDDTITGVAINTQLVLMKVFGDTSSGAETEDILAALEDSVKLGVDAINMSLGTSCGFSRSKDEEILNEIYDSVNEAGITLCAAASNDYSSGYGGEDSNQNKASNPDSSTVGSPSTYTSTFSVASIAGVKSKYITDSDGYLFYFHDANNATTKSYDFFEMLGIEKGVDVAIDYVTVPGVGKPVNYSNIDVRNKIALVRRGDISFQEKAQYAREAGAKGCIIYNNIGGEVSMSAGNDLAIAFCSISKDDGEYLAKKATGTLIFNTNNLAGPFMSDFSSWGPNPDLSIKPEITAHGGEIYSSVPGNKYDKQSGTSMASPNMCGIVILVRQYLKDAYPGITAKELQVLTSQLLMSTATIAVNEDNNPYFVRKQGSGLGNLKGAVTTKAYLTVDGMEKTKIELGDDKAQTGKYVLEFNLVNMSSDILSYTLSNHTMTESLSTSDSRYVAERSHMLSPSETLTVSGQGSNSGNVITVNPNGTVKIRYELQLNEEDKTYIKSSFENGMFVEGFAVLKPTDPEGVDLSVPFLSFFGDWTVAPIFDKTYYEVQKDEFDASIDYEDKIRADYYATRPLGTYYYDYVFPLGSYIYTIDSKYDPIPATDEHAAIGYNLENINGITCVYAGLLRSVKEMYTTITNAQTGEVVYDHVKYDQIKAHFSGQQNPAFDILNISIQDLGLQNNTSYIFRMDALLDYEDGGKDTNLNNYFEFKFTVDTEAPVLQNAEFYAKYDRSKKDNRYYVDLFIYDNNYAMSIRPFVLLEGELGLLTNLPIPIYSETRGSVTKVTIEITDYMDVLRYGVTAYTDEDGNEVSVKVTNGLGIMIDDYALNGAYYYLSLPGTSFSKLEFTDADGQKTNGLSISINERLDLTDRIISDDPDGIDKNKVGYKEFLQTMEWFSSDTSIATVVNGVVVGHKVGQVEITVKSIDAYGNEVKGKVTIRVRSSEVKPTKVNLESLDFTYFDTLKAFADGPEYSDIGKTGDRLFLNAKKFVSCYPSESVQLHYEIKPYDLDPSRVELEWSTTNSSVATVDENGVVVALKEGSAYITLRIYVDGKISSIMARCLVDVKNEFIVENRVLTGYKGVGGEVVIPDDQGIMYIGSFAFGLFTTDIEVDIDDSDVEGNRESVGNNTITKVIVPYDVVEIRRFAFANCTALEEVVFLKNSQGDTPKYIEEHAFYNCPSLTKINLENIEVIGSYAFYKCSSLNNIDLSSCYAFGIESFRECTALTNVDITPLRNAGYGSFAGCTALESVTMGEFTFLSRNMFDSCKLTNVDIYSDRIADNCFVNNSRLKTVTIHNNLVYVGQRAFANTPALESVVFEGTCDYLYNSAFANSAVKSIALPNSAVKLEGDVFKNCNKLNELIFNENTAIAANYGNALAGTNLTTLNVENSENYIIYNNILFNKDKTELVLALPGVNYQTVEIPSTVTKICEGAFSGINTLKDITIPANVEVVCGYAFANSSVENVVFEGNDVKVLNNAFENTSRLKTVNTDAIEAFEPYVFSKSAINTISIDGKEIKDHAFAGVTAASITVKNTSIGEYAFANSSIVTVELDNVEEIGGHAFANSRSLTTIDLSETKIIGVSAFEGCNKLVNLDLSAAEQIGARAFMDATNIETVKFDNIVSIGAYAFASSKLRNYYSRYYMIEGTEDDYEEVVNYYPTDEETKKAFTGSSNKIVTLVLPESLEYIGDHAFENSDLLTSIKIGNRLNYLGGYAFNNAAALTSVEINSTSLEKISRYAFADAENLVTANINGVVVIGASAFENCKSLTAFDFTETEIIDDAAFNGASSLTSLVLPEAIYVGERAFLNATKVTTISFEKIEAIGAFAFSETKASEILLPSTLKIVLTGAFFNMTNLSEFKSLDDPTNPDAIISDSVRLYKSAIYTKYPNNKYLLVAYPTGNESKTAEVMEGTVRVDYVAGGYNPYLSTIVLPSTLKTIGNNAFYGCSNLKVVEFRSTVAPTLESDFSITQIDYTEESLAYKFLCKYLPLNGVYPLYYNQFKLSIGISNTKLSIVLPENYDKQSYENNQMYNLYFDIDNLKTNGIQSMNSATLTFLDKYAKLPNVVHLNDESVIVDARTAYLAYVKQGQSLTDFGYTQAEVDQMVNKLETCENDFRLLKLERINSKYGVLISNIDVLGNKYNYSKIELYLSIQQSLDNISDDDKKYIDTANVEGFKEGYDAFFKDMNQDIATIDQATALSKGKVTKPGYVEEENNN